MIAGRYTLDREIGRGGMGAVWLGRDEVLGRVVALKRVGMLPGENGPDLERAGREARLAARLNHPHVVAIFDFVEDEEARWLVMEYVNGVTLAQLVKRDGALTPDQAAPLIRQAADALTAAHAAGIVHRDVKPSNILVTPDGEVKLSDFGIARAEADASLTQTGLVTGSPAYLAPEVASGSSAVAASDVWSLGATLFHALSGRPPYDVNENLMGSLYRIVHEEPPRLGNAGWLSQVLENTMTREPGDRWSMAQVRHFLEQDHAETIHPEPAGALPSDVEDSGTQVLHKTPRQPIAVPPVEPSAAVVPSASSPGTGGARRRSGRRGGLPVILAVVVLVAVVAIGIALLTSRGKTDDGTATDSTSTPPTSSSTSPSTSTSTSTSPTTGPTVHAMRTFLTDYLSTVTEDSRTTFRELTPAFQAASGGYSGYSGYWSNIRSARLTTFTADPKALTVTYDVAYVKVDGSRTTGHVTLNLTFAAGKYLIDGEA